MSDDEDKTLGDFFAKKDKGKKPKKKKKLKSNESADTQSEVASKTQVLLRNLSLTCHAVMQSLGHYFII